MNDAPVIHAFFKAMQMPAEAGSHGGASAGAGIPAISGTGSLASAFPVTAFATASIGTAAQALAGYMQQRLGICPAVAIDRRLASFWFGSSLKPQGWQIPAVRDPLTNDFQTRDGWIRLHANAAHHKAAILSALGTSAAPDEVARAIAGWSAIDLENAVVQAGGCAAMMRTQEEWASHPQGLAVKAEPLLHIEAGSAGPAGGAAATRLRPLRGIRILDLTRVLAGPVSTRFLAGYGAQVLRIDPPSWNEPGMVPEVTLGKRCAVLDFRETAQLDRFKALLAQADVLVHGYRAGALEGLGLDSSTRQSIRPGLVDVCLNAYGWTGPWSARRGFDSLVQMSNGTACAGMLYFNRDRPVPLPVQALDQATGYLMAAAVLNGLAHRLRTGMGSISRLSLARTGGLLASQSVSEPRGRQQEATQSAFRTHNTGEPLQPETAADYRAETESTDWGLAKRLEPPCELEGVPMQWDYPASALRSSPAQWEP